jgi:hypothetical protein
MPKTKSKYLVNGRAWVDKVSNALVRLDGTTAARSADCNAYLRTSIARSHFKARIIRDDVMPASGEDYGRRRFSTTQQKHRVHRKGRTRDSHRAFGQRYGSLGWCPGWSFGTSGTRDHSRPLSVVNHQNFTGYHWTNIYAESKHEN